MADLKKGSLSEYLFVKNLKGRNTRHPVDISWHGDGARSALGSINSCWLRGTHPCLCGSSSSFTWHPFTPYFSSLSDFSFTFLTVSLALCLFFFKKTQTSAMLPYTSLCLLKGKPGVIMLVYYLIFKNPPKLQQCHG